MESSSGDVKAEKQPTPSKIRFDDLPLSRQVLCALREVFGYETQTEVQAKTFEPILRGEDLVVRAKTGAGKTLSFLVPAMQRMLTCSKDSATMGTVDVLVVSPVRELSMQIYQETEKLVRCSDMRAVCMTGGVDWKEDLTGLDAAGSAVTFLIATPGRLQTHVNKTAGFADRLAKAQILILDEVDQLASDIFKAAVLEIVGVLPAPAQRQSLFYSATMSAEVTTLVKQAGKADYAYVDVLQDADISVPDQIDQTYCIISTEDMTRALWKAIQVAKEKDDAEPKVVVIFMTGRIASYYAEAFRKSASGLAVFEIHARLKQNKRTEESDRFREATSGILFTSDVSSRGLDYPGVTEVIQMGAPHSKAEYIHRLGRTGRGGNRGRGLLLLHDFETCFLKELEDLPLDEVKHDSSSSDTLPDFMSMDIPKNVKAQAYYSRINHVMRNPGDLSVLEIMREAKRFAASVGALDAEGRPPEIIEDNAAKMGVADLDDPAVYIVANSVAQEAQAPKAKSKKQAKAKAGYPNA